MSNSTTFAQRQRMSAIAELGCIIRTCQMPAVIHHCFTGAGGRRDHDKIIGLCPKHHTGDIGIHTIGRKAWQKKHGTEQELIDKTNEILKGK